MNRIASLLLLLLSAQLSAHAHTATYKCRKWHIPAANYSGITPLGDGCYAVVSDQEEQAGFYLWNIHVDLSSGQLLEMESLGWKGTPYPIDRDAEGIAWCEPRQSFFVSGEADQRILEHRLDGSLTGYELQVPSSMDIHHIQTNRGFEALTYDPFTRLFWTVTESPLRGDEPLRLRMQSFSLSLQPEHEYPYRLDAPQSVPTGRDYYHGVVALAPLGNGRLLVLAREARIARRYAGSRCWCKLFLFDPSTGSKRLLHVCSSRFTLFNTRVANYEGMCLGPTLLDGRPTVLLLSDSQGGYGKVFWHLRDRLRIIVLDKE